MKKSFAQAILWGSAAVVCIMALLTMNVYASEPITGFEGGPGVCYDVDGNIVAADLDEDGDAVISEEPGAIYTANGEEIGDNKELSEVTEIQLPEGKGHSGEAVGEMSTDDTVFKLDGKDYVKGEYWGEHRLTGYSGEQWGTRTASGATAKARHTVSATSALPFGTVIIIDGGTGRDVEEYNGIYVVEDRGGNAIENEGIVDIFFDTHAEALAVTEHGWNTADIWIAVPV